MQMTPWAGNTAGLKRLQEDLRHTISLKPLSARPRLIGGADLSLNRGSKTVYAGIVVLNYETLDPVEEIGVVDTVEVPYIPGFLSFREVPALLRAWHQLQCKPDVVMLDGHGILHPRSMGVATHFGLEAEVATMGCAKKRLVGEFQLPGDQPHNYCPVTVAEEKRGFIYRSRLRANPIFISPGTGMNCDDALEIARHCLRGYRLPEPTRLAHQFVNRLRRQHLNTP